MHLVWAEPQNFPTRNAPVTPAWWPVPITFLGPLAHSELATCSASEGQGCAIYDQRPDICRAYDCTTDPLRYEPEQDGARCDLKTAALTAQGD